MAFVRFRFRWLLLYGWITLTAAGADIELSILATADLHGRLRQLDEAIRPAVEAERRRLPDGVLYLDAGDTAQGTLDMWRTRGKGALELLGRARCDAWTPGNHEIEFGVTPLIRMTHEFPGAVLAANLRAPELADRVKPFIVFERRGVKIAVIGLMLGNMNANFPVPETRFQTLSGSAVLGKTVDAARAEGAEIVVLLRHAGMYGGGENLSQLLADAPGIDLVIGAHTHKAEAGRLLRGVWFVQPPPFGKKLAHVKLTFDPVRRKLRQIESRLMELPVLPEKPSAEASAPAPVVSSPPETYAARAMRRAVGADVAVYSVKQLATLRTLAALSNPTVGDYYRIFPYFDAVVNADLTDGDLRAILSEYAKFAHRRHETMTADGMMFRTAKGRIGELKFDVPKPLYRVAFTSYVAAGTGGMLPETRRILRSRWSRTNPEKAPPLLDCLLQKASEVDILQVDALKQER